MEKYWNNIKTKYPKAFASLVTDHDTREEWGQIDNPKIWGEHVDEPQWVLRHLFDFFDKRNVMIEIVVDYTRSGYGCALFAWQVGMFGQVDTSDDGDFKSKVKFSPELHRSRAEAELEAFEEGFRLLEEIENS